MESLIGTKIERCAIVLLVRLLLLMVVVVVVVVVLPLAGIHSRMWSFIAEILIAETIILAARCVESSSLRFFLTINEQRSKCNRSPCTMIQSIGEIGELIANWLNITDHVLSRFIYEIINVLIVIVDLFADLQKCSNLGRAVEYLKTKNKY